jgi:transposase InsO family protein
MRYRFVEGHREEFRVKKMCKVLKISKSGYYTWRGRRPSRRQLGNELLLEQIREVHKQSRGTYGSPRVSVELNEQGISCGKNRVARIMRVNDIQAKTKKKYKATTDSRHRFPVAENLLLKEEQQPRSTVWASDITYIPTDEGWLYLAGIMNLRYRKIIGLSMKDRLTQDITINALKQAIGRDGPTHGLIHHSDRGSQYACKEYQGLLQEHGILPSMSRKGNCYDNAFMESFFHTLKTELIYGQRYRTRQEAMLSIFEYIEVFYNRMRRHSALGYKSPAEYERLQNAA